MRTALTSQQTEALHRLASHPDGKSLFCLLQAELDATLTDLVDAADDQRLRPLQGEARAYRGILATIDAAVFAVRGAPPANPLLAGGRPNQTGNPTRLPANGGS